MHMIQRVLLPCGALVLLAAGAAAQEPVETKWVPGPPPKITDGTTTIVVLPDTENYTYKHPDMFFAQTKWIADEATNRNIAYVIHLGDITQHNNDPQWTVARKSFDLIEGKIPYALVPGNDDYDDLVDNNWQRLRDSSLINRYFDPARIAKWPTFGGFHQPSRLENTYHLFRMHNRDWMILCLELGPRDEVVRWADGILAKHQDRRTIVVTHAYLYRNNQRYDHTRGIRERASPQAWGHDGEELWQKLIKKHANVMIVMSGHVATGGKGYRKDDGDHGNAVHQMMCDYQKKPMGGLAYLRLLEFAPDGKTVQVRTYSPYRRKLQVSKLEDFTFELQDAAASTPSSE
jgi:hypothetical protein